MAANSIKRQFRDLFKEVENNLSDKSKAKLNEISCLSGKELYELTNQLHKTLIDEKNSVIENLLDTRFCTEEEIEDVIESGELIEDIDIFNAIMHFKNDSIFKWPDFLNVNNEEKDRIKIIYDRITADCKIKLQNLIKKADTTNQVIEFLCLLYLRYV